MKIGIITYHRSINYGAYLQAYALSKTLLNYNLNTEIIDFNTYKSVEMYKPNSKVYSERIRYSKKVDAFVQCLKLLPLSKESLVSDSIDEFNAFVKGKYDIIIAGSDEIWRTDNWRGFPNPYWLSGVTGVTKMSYAASSRSDLKMLRIEEQNFIKDALSDYTCISVRDQYTFNELKWLLNDSRKLQLNCDPVFLYKFTPNRNNGKNILLNKYHVNPKKKILGVMLIDDVLAYNLQKKYKGECEVISLYRILSGFKNVFVLNPFDWIDVISCFDLFVTDFFHGTCFALKMNVQFISVESRTNDIERSKIYDILYRNFLLDRFFSSKDVGYLQSILSLCDKLLYNSIDKIEFNSVTEREMKNGMSFFNKWIHIFENT